MAVNLKEVFDRAVDRYLESEPSSDEDPAALVSPPPVAACPASPSSVNNKSISPQNSRKRSRKPIKKPKPTKAGKSKKGKDIGIEKEESEPEKDENVVLRSKPGKDKKSGKYVKKKYAEDEDDDDEDELISPSGKRVNSDSEDETYTVKSKRKKSTNFDRSASKTKKASPKEEQPDDSKRRSKKEPKVEEDEKIKKEDFEDDFSEMLRSARNRSKKNSKRELDALLGKSKKDKSKNTVTFKANGSKRENFETNLAKVKKNRGKKEETIEKNVVPILKGEERRTNDKEKDKDKDKDKERLPKGKDKKLKQDREKDLKGSVLKNSTQTNDNSKVDKYKDEAKYKKLVTSNKDLESLDSLKDIISERQREDKLKAQMEGERHKKSIKKDSVGLHSKKVPSNGSCLRPGSKGDPNLSRSKDPVKEEPASGGKKPKAPQVKRPRGFKKEDSPRIQALNQATEQTLNVSQFISIKNCLKLFLI